MSTTQNHSKDTNSQEILNKLVTYEQRFYYQDLPKIGETEFATKAGTIPVLISAPHSAVHKRNGKNKEEDEFTGALAVLLAELTGAFAIYATNRSETDPNKDKDVPYKNSLGELCSSNKICFVLDIHGANADRDFGLAIGTMNGKSCTKEMLEDIVFILGKYGFNQGNHDRKFSLDINGQFPAASIETVTKYVWETLHIPVMQIEINASLRIVSRKSDASQTTPFWGNREGIFRTVLALQDMILKIGGPHSSN